jgi:hypothetical protein
MSNIRYGMLIDSKPVGLIFMHEDKDGYHYHAEGALSQVHSFPWPLGKLPIDENFKHKNHTYTIKTKP